MRPQDATSRLGQRVDLEVLARLRDRTEARESVRKNVSSRREVSADVLERLESSMRFAAANHAETTIHRAADRFLPKMQAVVNYAFRRGQEELELPPDPREVSRAIYDAIMERMPPVLYEVAVAGAASALGELERKLVRSTLTRGREISERPDDDSAVRGLSMRTLQDPALAILGGPGSGNFGHAGRPGQVGGSAPSGTIAVGKTSKGLAFTVTKHVASWRDEERAYYTVKGANGQIIGHADLSLGNDYLSYISVHPNKRRQGIATALYDVIEKDLGRPLRLSPDHASDAAKAVWESRDRLKTLGGPSMRTLQDPPEVSFKVILNAQNKAAARWAREQSERLAKQLSETTERAIREAVAFVHEHGDLKGMLRKVREAVGDDQRAKIISRTETMKAANEGQRQVWREAVAENVLPDTVRRVWIATEVDACPICENLDGKTTDLNGQYPDDGGDGPPAHPNCRCTEGIVGD